MKGAEETDGMIKGRDVCKVLPAHFMIQYYELILWLKKQRMRDDMVNLSSHRRGIRCVLTASFSSSVSYFPYLLHRVTARKT